MSGTGSSQEDGEGLVGMGVSPGRHSGAEGVEVRMSPGGGEIVTRWAGDQAWQRVGGTDDGELVPDAEVGGWTRLVPEARVVGYRPLELGEQARHTEALAGALRETWMAGEQLNMERPVGERIDWLRWAHAIEQRLAGLNDWEPGPAEPFAPVTAPVDTVERGRRG